uniref:Nuclear receptor domain-containing protein n=1 Tax=Meloidogyne hapla TaxID=6305 RepID=A0A1I8BB30_MELHA
MSYTVSPAFKGLSCLICGQQAHGNRFGAVCCLPYSLKKCKACRYRQCRSVGMQITTIDHNTVEKETFLEKFVAAYENYINAQQQIFFNLYPERLNEKLPFFIPENLQCIHYFEQNCKPAMLEMLNSSIYEFEELEVLEKVFIKFYVIKGPALCKPAKLKA